MKLNNSRFIFLYMKEHVYQFAIAVACVLVFAATFALSGIPLKYVWYPALIDICIMIVVSSVDIVKSITKHRELMQLKKNIDIMLDYLPEEHSMLEQDYQMLLRELQDQSKEVLNQVTRSKKETMEYVTLWTHQIKTPLTALQLLTADIEEPQRSEILPRLFEIEQYGDMMLQYLRLEGGSADYVLESYSVRAMVNQAVKYYARIFISKGISVNIDISDDFKVVTDEKWMVFVLKQIISNAIKYTCKGCVSVYVKDMSLVIEDTGIGIAGEDLPRIFERGYTGYNGRKDKKATGLGLFLVDRILKKLNHPIRIESEINRGTKVMITFK